MKIMIVDDEELIRLGIAKILNKSELSVQIAGLFANGYEAYMEISRLQPGDLDVLITDIKMPIMDGLRLIEKAKERLPELSVIVISGFNEFEYARQAMRFGVTDYFLKPLDKYDLFQVLTQISRKLDNDGIAEGEGIPKKEGEPEHYVIERIKQMLDKEFDKTFDLDKIAERVELSPSYVSKLFRQETGLTITDYLISVRLNKAKQFLIDYPQLKNYEISSMLGYSDPVYFNKLFKKMVGLTPKEYKEKHT
ncbi:response regulator [Paenibacillus sp. GCM10023248]|uniref:response regulator transcription factor n=1 Tax=unclassified Paenibacillus TaxID=185978 RepID=UPI0023797900|nr:response regulator [Paenibacillus sp. MAHUQ-63]MDD9267070.1 response regulator [Paenibacillus sp. MAHUQ-63]